MKSQKSAIHVLLLVKKMTPEVSFFSKGLFSNYPVLGSIPNSGKKFLLHSVSHDKISSATLGDTHFPSVETRSGCFSSLNC